MSRLKKILYFTLGEIVVPFLLGVANTFIFGNDAFNFFYGYFLLVFLLCYFLFPVFYRGKMVERFSSRYAFYGVMYLGFEVLGILLFFI